MNMLEQAIVDGVNNSGGLKATELAANVAGSVSADSKAFVKTLDKLIKMGELVEIEYVRPDAPEKIKSFLLPKGTEILNFVPKKRATEMENRIRNLEQKLIS